ncbi:MAG: PD-(D/E)XK nuclease family protein [Candidatus Eisenbacteria bacterium]
MRPEFLSASQISCFLACPAKYRFRYVDRASPAFRPSGFVLGNVVHSALEWLHKSWLAGTAPSEEDLLVIFEADLSAQTVEEIRMRNGETVSSLQETGRNLVRLYFSETEARAPRGAEVPFEVDLVHPATGEVLDAPLRGWFDLIEADGTLVELKTAARRPDETALTLHPQLSAYSYAAARIYRERPGLRLDCLLKTKKPRLERISVERSETDDARIFVLARSVLRAVEAESFFPNPGWQCEGCEFRHLCPAWDV